MQRRITVFADVFSAPSFAELRRDALRRPSAGTIFIRTSRRACPYVA
jgi:hypothetical protein